MNRKAMPKVKRQGIKATEKAYNHLLEVVRRLKANGETTSQIIVASDAILAIPIPEKKNK